MFIPLFQYQIKAEVPFVLGTIPRLESTFHEPLSEPVRQKINPQLAVALIASGFIAPVLNPNTQIIQKYESRFHFAWSEPVRLRPDLHASRQSFTAYANITAIPDSRLVRYQPLSEPVRLRPGLRSSLQQTLAIPPRLLPTPNILVTMNILETLKDVALFGVDININVPKPYVLFAGANVTITNVPAIKGGALSIEEET